MGKQARARKLEDNQASATLKMLKTSPQKLGLVAGLIRGLDVESALLQLQFSKKRIANDVRKLLLSAIANAENNHDLDIDQLYISEVLVGKSLVMRRFRARARGRGAAIQKPFSNITIIVSEQQEEESS